eukprot:scaffold317630_cov52-Prasinocladus_malaysianus.AAC.1
MSVRAIMTLTFIMAPLSLDSDAQPWYAGPQCNLSTHRGGRLWLGQAKAAPRSRRTAHKAGNGIGGAAISVC